MTESSGMSFFVTDDLNVRLSIIKGPELSGGSVVKALGREGSEI